MQNKYDPIMEKLNYQHIGGGARHPIGEEDISKLEMDVGCRLPVDYRTFLLKFGGVGSKAGPFLVGDPAHPDASVDVFYGLDSNSSNSVLRIIDGLSLPPDYLPIASSAGGLILIGIAGERTGRVYWFDPSGYAEDDPELLAQDFDSFLRSLSTRSDRESQ